MPPNIPSYVSKRKIAVKAILLVIVLVTVLTGIWVYVATTTPSDFSGSRIIRVEEGSTVSEVAVELHEAGLIGSELFYKLLVRLFSDGRGVQAGSYSFEEPESVLSIARRMIDGQGEMPTVKITIPEGVNSREIAAIVKEAFPDLDGVAFISLARENEGYLFPETYFLNIDSTPAEIISVMRQQFDQQLLQVASLVASSTRTLTDIVTMASIIEEEARIAEDRRLISGILWKRLDKGMLLQVDAPFYYLFGKTSEDLTVADLATTSSYNTYLRKGLPPGPISNPSLDAIQAALEPVSSAYYYYLADDTGVTHYAVTHEGHVANKARYLR